MNKKLLPLVVIIVLLAVGGYYLKTKQTNSPMTSKELVGEANKFASAIESGKPTICTMKKDADSMEYHIKGKAMRMNSTTTMKDDSGKTSTTVAHMINDTKYLYMWDDTSKQGSKMAIPSEEETKDMADKAKEYQQDTEVAPKLETQADYDNFKNEGYSIECKSASVDDSVFAPPADVKFIDPTEMMNALPAQGEDGKFDMSQIEELQKQYGGQIPANY